MSCQNFYPACMLSVKWSKENSLHITIFLYFLEVCFAEYDTCIVKFWWMRPFKNWVWNWCVSMYLANRIPISFLSICFAKIYGAILFWRTFQMRLGTQYISVPWGLTWSELNISHILPTSNQLKKALPKDLNHDFPYCHILFSFWSQMIQQIPIKLFLANYHL